MSSFSVTLEVLEIFEHLNADALELAKVGEYRAVVPKGVYRTGDIALYVPDGAVLPSELISELGLEGKLAGKEQNRVKPIRLRGELSQGIVCQPKAIWELYTEDELIDICEGDHPSVSNEWAEYLGITKWVPPVPAGMGGDVEPAYGIVHWIDIENIKRMPDMFIPDEPVVVSEKIHGTCCLITYFPNRDELYVSSKGLGGKNLRLLESEKNVYWRAIRRYQVQETLREIASVYLWADAIGLFGEVYGPGIQDLSYSMKEQQFAVFDICLRSHDGKKLWVDQPQVVSLMENSNYWQQTVPILYEGPYNYGQICTLSEGPEMVSGRQAHMREGVVVRSMLYDGRMNPDGDRPIAKFISEQYLLRKGVTTEYE